MEGKSPESKKLEKAMIFIRSGQGRPHSDHTKIVFLQKSNDYSKSDFNPAILQGRATEADIDRVLNNLKESSYFRPSMQLRIVTTALLFVLVFGVTFEIAFFVAGSYFSGSDSMAMKLLIGFFSVMIVVLCIMCCLIFKANKLKDIYLKNKKADFEERLSRFNEQDFKGRGLRWSIGLNARWIQLHLDFVTEAAEYTKKSPFGPQGGAILGNEYVVVSPGPRCLGGLDGRQDLGDFP